MNDDSGLHALFDLVEVEGPFNKVFGTLAHLRLGKGEVTQVRSGHKGKGVIYRLGLGAASLWWF